MQKDQFQKIKKIEDFPQKYQKILEDKNQNGKPDFFEDSLPNIVKKVFQLITQKNPQFSKISTQKISTLQVVVLIIIAIPIILFAFQFFPFLIFIGIAYFFNQTKTNKKGNFKKPASSLFKILQTKKQKKIYPYSQNQIPKIPSATNNLKNSLSEAIRIVLLIGIIGYCFYWVWLYL